MTLEEKRLDYEVIEEDLSEPSAELRRLHPECKVPLLIHEGRAIFESAIITEYLDEAFPAARLMPVGALARAETRLWTFWANEILKPDLDAYKYEWRKMGIEDRAALRGRLDGHLARLDEGLAAGDFLFGSELTLADIHLFPFYRQLQKSQPDFGETFPLAAGHLNGWLARIVARPSFERVMARPAPPLAPA